MYSINIIIIYNNNNQSSIKATEAQQPRQESGTDRRTDGQQDSKTQIAAEKLTQRERKQRIENNKQ